jgi:hypothetical protein
MGQEGVRTAQRVGQYANFAPPQQLYDAKGPETVISVVHNYDNCEIRVVAVDKSRKEIPATSLESNPHRVVARFTGLMASNVAAKGFQIRPYCRVTFRDVVIEPGGRIGKGGITMMPPIETQVEIIESSPAEAPELSPAAARQGNAKVIELGSPQLEKHVLKMTSDSALRPNEKITALVSQPDGRMQEWLTTTYTIRDAAGARSSTVVNWATGEGVAEEQLQRAFSILEKLAHRPIQLTWGIPVHVFSITNANGGIQRGFLEYRVESAEPLFKTDVRIVRINAWPGQVSAEVSPNIPRGYVLQALATDSSGSEVDTRTSSGRSPGYNSIDFSWYFPSSLAFTNTAQAEAQLREFMDGVPLTLGSNERKQVFAVTNDFGQVYRAYLELLGARPN